MYFHKPECMRVLNTNPSVSPSFELVVYLEGTTESTGNTMQARFSYQPTDILWGHRFENVIAFDKSSDNYAVDFREFNKTKEVGVVSYVVYIYIYICSGGRVSKFCRSVIRQRPAR